MPLVLIPHLRGMLFWLMDDLSHAQSPGVEWVVLLLGMVLCLPLADQLNVLSRGELQASALGVAVKPLRLQVYILASLFTVVAVILGVFLLNKKARNNFILK